MSNQQVYLKFPWSMSKDQEKNTSEVERIEHTSEVVLRPLSEELERLETRDRGV